MLFAQAQEGEAFAAFIDAEIFGSILRVLWVSNIDEPLLSQQILSKV